MRDPQRRLRILTSHIHGNDLWRLTQVPHDFDLMTDATQPGFGIDRSVAGWLRVFARVANVAPTP